jgi:hypothetical protein
MKMHIMFASVALAAVSLAAGIQAAPTNVLEKISLQLVVESQLPPKTNKNGTITENILSSALTSGGLIKALGTDTNITTNGFSSGAYLAFDTVVTNGTNLPPIIVVVEGAGTNISLTPVGDDITTGVRGVVLHDGTTKTNGNDTTTAYRIRTLDINITNEWSLKLTGLAERNVVDVTQGSGKSALHVDASDILWKLAGHGGEGSDTNSTPVIVTGTLSSSYSKILE